MPAPGDTELVGEDSSQALLHQGSSPDRLIAVSSPAPPPARETGPSRGCTNIWLRALLRSLAAWPV